MSGSLLIKNQQRAFSVNAGSLRQLAHTVLQELLELEDYDLVIVLVRASRMAELNDAILQHKGSTDVITLDYGSDEIQVSITRPDSTKAGAKLKTRIRDLPPAVRGEIFISLDDARENARRFRTNWQSEVARYVIHGILHLQGYDDLKPLARRKMKRVENRLLKQIARRFPLKKIAGKT